MEKGKAIEIALQAQGAETFERFSELMMFTVEESNSVQELISTSMDIYAENKVLERLKEIEQEEIIITNAEFNFGFKDRLRLFLGRKLLYHLEVRVDKQVKVLGSTGQTRIRRFHWPWYKPKGGYHEIHVPKEEKPE